MQPCNTLLKVQLIVMSESCTFWDDTKIQEQAKHLMHYIRGELIGK